MPAIVKGHPWVYRDALAPEAIGRLGDLASGTSVDIAAPDGAFIGRGLVDPNSPIAVRLWTREAGEVPGPGLLRERIRTAAAARRQSLGHDVGAFRLLHGEADRTPGMIVDIYEGVAVMQLDTPALASLVRPAAEAVLEELPGVAGVVLREKTRGQAASLVRLAGELPDFPITVRESDAVFEVDPASGHKTGLYLDQRPNRLRVHELAAGLEVLNLFAYTGGFSIMAALGGASRVVSVDTSAPALEAARRNFRHSGLDADSGAYKFVVADVFEFLGESRQSFDLVIVDPPSMAPSAKSKAAATKAYQDLQRLALARVRPRGLLLTASCSSHFGESDLMSAVAEAAAATDRDARVLEVRGPGPDHPISPWFPEGRYLRSTSLVSVRGDPRGEAERRRRERGGRRHKGGGRPSGRPGPREREAPVRRVHGEIKVGRSRRRGPSSGGCRPGR